jgi:hypothetical protein
MNSINRTAREWAAAVRRVANDLLDGKVARDDMIWGLRKELATAEEIALYLYLWAEYAEGGA